MKNGFCKTEAHCNQKSGSHLAKNIRHSTPLAFWRGVGGEASSLKNLLSEDFLQASL